MQTQDVDDMARPLPLPPHRFISARETVSFDEDVLFISFFFFSSLKGPDGYDYLNTKSAYTTMPDTPLEGARSDISRIPPESKKRHTLPISYQPKTKERKSYLISLNLTIFTPFHPSPHPPPHHSFFPYAE